MTSILASPTQTFNTNSRMNQMDAPGIGHLQESLQHSRVQSETGQKSRGRRKSQASQQKVKVNLGEGAIEDEDDEGNSSGSEGNPRKRRRSRKGLDKKFDCPQEGCGKSYSRAEHLYRHQLNHTPKQIYRCDFADCTRQFVRQDLRNRHRDRHNAKGSQLHRKDSMLGHHNASPTTESPKTTIGKESASPELMKSTASGSKPHINQIQFQAQHDIHNNTYSPLTRASTATYSGSGSTNGADGFMQPSTFKRSNSDTLSRTDHMSPASHNNKTSRHSSFSTADAKPVEFSRPLGPYGLVSTGGHVHNYQNSQANPQTYVSSQNMTTFSLPPPGFHTQAITTTSIRDPDPIYPTSTEYAGDAMIGQQSGPDMMLLDQMTASSTLPVFGGEGGYNRSPFAIPEDFVAYLFSQQMEGASPMAQLAQQGFAPEVINQYYAPYLTNDVNLPGWFPVGQPQHPMSVTSLLETSLPESTISEEKSQAIVDLIRDRFPESDNSATGKHKEEILEGDRSDDSHMLSRKMMQTYIGSYWYHFSEQVPILHQPTFSPDKTPDLLLIAMMAIGASCLDKEHGYQITQAGAGLSNFLSWGLRFELFMHPNSQPPAKLWVFQAFLLLELYEKMYSTRALHERAHIHHATTITLMRRGSSLIGRSALDSPPSVRDDKTGANGSRHSSTSGANTPDEWWNHWITNEATKRAAYAAFVIDSTHATMFGHSTVMVAHEMRLPLPCDESLWNATNSAEVGRIESGLAANGIKPISFLEGLKKTLNGQTVRTNSFGRTILMAGLLSVSWHMNQRDLQVNSLGVTQALGGRDKWRGALTRAFDLWKTDFDQALIGNTGSLPDPYVYSDKRNENVVSQNRIVLHHLAHMAMHVDIVDCQIFARAKRLLGRTIGSQDLNSAQRRMKDAWAPTAKARDATWYALQFLCTVLLPEEDPGALQPGVENSTFDYSARDDVLLNRPWVMYFAALIVWCYAFALEGPTTQPVPDVYDFDGQVREMRTYLRRLGSIQSPEELKDFRGFNGCTAMLMVLRHVFEKTRWELLHEASVLLNNCIALITNQ